MNADLEATMARGRAAGITHRVAIAVGTDGRTVRLQPDGQEVVSFAGCGYLALERDPRLVNGAIDAIHRCGVSFGASRCFVTTPMYAEAEALLAQVFDRPVVLAGSTTLAHGAALPILLDAADAVLFDHQVHHSVQVALASLAAAGVRSRPVAHADFEALESGIRDAVARGARRIWYCADGVYSMFGDRLRIGSLGALMHRYPQLHAYLDDAHGMSWCGPRGAGSVFDPRLPPDRTVVATSLSKGFGAGGGAIVVPDLLTKHRIENLGPSLMFSIQLPPPVLGAIRASAAIHASPEIIGLQRTVADRVAFARARLVADPAVAARLPILDPAPTPIQYVVLGDEATTIGVARRLLDQGLLVNPVAYPAVPRGSAGIRFTVTRAHTEADLARLIDAIAVEVRALGELRAPRRFSRVA
ncbi:MAG: aminotransferase class I/II-fold pyridoxal phosphate-dependent enzyme [Myxococcota bacterium]